MSKKNIFHAKYMDLYTEYGYGVGCISDIIQGIGFDLRTMSSTEAKKEALEVIEQLLYYNLICVEHWGSKNHHLKFKKMNVGIDRTMNVLKTQWFNGANSYDFFEMVTFSYRNWYHNKLQELGVDDNMDWDWFGKVVIPKIKEWAEESIPSEGIINVNTDSI